jgi:hypothetical protein
MPPGASSPYGEGPHTTQLCLTQAMIDKYGAPLPQGRNNQCQITDVHKKPGSMIANWICNGMIPGKAYIESYWTDSYHATTKVHFLGSTQVGSGRSTVEYTIVASSVYKSPDCGALKPQPVPDNSQPAK